MHMLEFDFAQAEKDFIGGELFSDAGVMNEPRIAQQTAQARELNVLLQDMPITFAEALTVQAELEEGVSEWIDTEVPVTGTLVPNYEEEHAQKHELTPALLRDMPVKFLGFIFQGDFESDETRAAYGVKYQFAFEAPAKLFNEDLSGKAARKKVQAYGDFDLVCIDPEFITSERSMQWLQSVAPDLIHAIDCQMGNDDTTMKGGELLSLRWFNWDDYDHYLKDPFTRECLERYIQHLVNFDDSVQYSLAVNGDTATEKYGELNEKESEQLNRGVLVRVYGPYLKFSENSPEGMKWNAQIEAAVFLSGQQDEIPPLIEVDVDHCKELFDMRSYYYDQRKQ